MKKPLWITFILVILIGAYIVISTTFINEKAYMKRAWDESNHNKHIINWEEGEVSTNSLQDKNIKQLFIPKRNTFAKINRSLLWINGNKAVRVLFHTDNEGLIGPITVYFNPFTKQVIGYDVKE
ncbi:hypothetical protein FHS15_005147 [Paenibacillus castaneae]|uniref:hypothetical protein n=1 Tax=Paenibacillus castaneae TaxID=474957 RepID=UPI000C9B94B0|nr:hypothetical protein [Paenibacillus castaneae]NIK79963.1 hypothetical protein [Paenibacillus castaneae]